jgi:hypothetical protein
LFKSFTLKEESIVELHQDAETPSDVLSLNPTGAQGINVVVDFVSKGSHLWTIRFGSGSDNCTALFISLMSIVELSRLSRSLAAAGIPV